MKKVLEKINNNPFYLFETGHRYLEETVGKSIRVLQHEKVTIEVKVQRLVRCNTVAIHEEKRALIGCLVFLDFSYINGFEGNVAVSFPICINCTFYICNVNPGNDFSVIINPAIAKNCQVFKDNTYNKHILTTIRSYYLKTLDEGYPVPSKELLAEYAYLKGSKKRMVGNRVFKKDNLGIGLELEFPYFESWFDINRRVWTVVTDNSQRVGNLELQSRPFTLDYLLSGKLLKRMETIYSQVLKDDRVDYPFSGIHIHISWDTKDPITEGRISKVSEYLYSPEMLMDIGGKSLGSFERFCRYDRPAFAHVSPNHIELRYGCNDPELGIAYSRIIRMIETFLTCYLYLFILDLTVLKTSLK